MNPTPSRVTRSLCAIVATTFLVAGLPMNAFAGVIGTPAALEAAAVDATRAANLDQVQSALARQDVQAQLESLGVAPTDAMRRAAALNDTDLAKLSGSLQQLPAGGDAGIFALIGAVFVVLLVLDYLDVVHVFHHRR